MNPNLYLGDPLIDHQHAELFQSLQKLIAHGRTEESVSDILSTLTAQIYKHFKTEETVMNRLDLPPPILQAHQLAHQQIIEELTNIHLDAMYGVSAPLEQTIRKVAACVNHHLVEFDLGLKPYIQASG